MSDKNTLILNGEVVPYDDGETIWQVATRTGVEIPHLCYLPKPGYRADGNCRACMVEVKGERVLAASCLRKCATGMEVNTASERAKKSRALVFEMLLADQPKDKAGNFKNPDGQFATMVKQHGFALDSRFPKNQHKAATAQDFSHPAMAVQLDACIQCNLCVRACREVQVNDVIGMAGRGFDSEIVFDQHDAMGHSTCVACGECVAACPTGALMPQNQMVKAVEANDNKAVGDFKPMVLKETDSGCPFCGVGCQTKIYTSEDKNTGKDFIVKVDGRDGPANHNKLCVKGRFGMDYARHDDRLQYPLVRRADAPAKKWDDQINKDNLDQYFRRASWDEALEIIGNNFTAVLQQHGGKGLAGFGSAKGSNEEAYLFQKLVRTGFKTNNVDHCTRLCHASSVAALMEGISSGAVSAPFTDALLADVIIVIGSRPTENHPVAATFFKQAAKQGKKIIVMDPRKSGITRHAWKHLQFKGGTDVALLSAMINTIIEEDLINEDYIKQYVENYEGLKERNKKFTPEKMASICGIPADEIRAVARAYATAKKSIIFWGMGVSQHVHGTDNARCLIALAGITGQIGQAGTGLHPLRGQNNVQGASDAGLIPMFFPDYKSVENIEVRKFYEDFWGMQLDPKRGLTVVEILGDIMKGVIRAMYIMGENPAMSDPDMKHAREALAKLEFLVCQEIFLTETCFFADVILPASAYPEKSGSFTNSNRQVQLAKPALRLLGECKQDWEIVQLIANQIGLDWQYKNVGEVYEEMRQTMPSITGITWARLQRDGVATYPCADEKPGKAVIFGSGFPTASGKMKLVPVDLLPPDEVPDKEFPTILTTGRLLEHWHTGAMTRRAQVLDGLEWAAVAHLHPQDMAEKNITQGDDITISTRRGEITVPVRADRDVARGMVFVPFCFAEGAANMLTNPALDPFGKIPEFKFCAAKVAKSDGKKMPSDKMGHNIRAAV
ncbi:MAG: formate dehydrogenase subunit alpha [Hydrotalea sp.]|nr:formate dehydrogenase subunit alpha [Hydrotalea sp.]